MMLKMHQESSTTAVRRQTLADLSPEARFDSIMEKDGEVEKDRWVLYVVAVTGSAS